MVKYSCKMLLFWSGTFIRTRTPTFPLLITTGEAVCCFICFGSMPVLPGFNFSSSFCHSPPSLRSSKPRGATRRGESLVSLPSLPSFSWASAPRFGRKFLAISSLASFSIFCAASENHHSPHSPLLTRPNDCSVGRGGGKERGVIRCFGFSRLSKSFGSTHTSTFCLGR